MPSAAGPGGDGHAPNVLEKNKGRAFFGGPARVILTAIAIFLTGQIVAAIIIGLFVASSHPRVDLADFIADSPFAQFGLILIAEAIAIWLVWWLLKRRQLNWRKIGFSRRPQWRDLGWGLLGLLAFYALVIVAGVVIKIISPDTNLDQQQDVGFNELSGSLAWILSFIGLVILPPLGEETLVRGYLYTGLRASLRFVPALVITSLLFGLAHYQTDSQGHLSWAIMLDTALLSVVLVYLREKSGVLYAAMVVHLLNNAVAYFIHF
ncbi:CPBP family intramembrane metalloprotease [Candidatus Saccharibacteria bacterium]|nr:CPBP family intramembrane metalloprotease [Candidatus Saccharibacteria bacterium]